MAIGKCEATGPIVVGSRPVDHFLLALPRETWGRPHRGKSGVVETLVVLVYQNKRAGRSGLDEVTHFAKAEPGTVTRVAVAAIQPWTVHREFPLGRIIRIGTYRLAHGKSAGCANTLLRTFIPGRG